MNKNKFIVLCIMILAIGFTFNSNVFAQETEITNSEIIELTKAGLDKSIIIQKIRASKTNFDLSTDSLIQLKQAGVADEVVGAMLKAKTGVAVGNSSAQNTQAGDPNDPMSPHSFGIYLFEETGGEKKMTQMQPNVSAQNRKGGGFTAAVTPFGLGKRKTKANLPGTNASLQITDSSPSFYFYLDTKSGGLNTASGIPSTPNEFALVRFNIRSDNREITIAKENAYSAKGGLSDEYVIAFDSEDMGNGTFKITPKSPLKNGEYAFYLLNSGNSNASEAIGSKFFDFGVKLTP